MSDSAASRLPWKSWLFLAVPAVGLLELGAHVYQTSSAVVPDADWQAARAIVAKSATPADLVVFAPFWVDPVGRAQFGDQLATLDREARPDETRFPRAFEVSIRGAHRAELRGWREVGTERAGKVVVTTFENPAPALPKTILVSQVSPASMTVTRVDRTGESECVWSESAAPQTGGLGFGPAIPAAKFDCPGGGFVGVTVIAALDYSPRKCIYAPPQGGGSFIRIRFKNVTFGNLLHGHHGLSAEAERNKADPSVSLKFIVGDHVLGHVVHADGDGWKPFDLNTSDVANTQADLVAEVSSSSGNRRLYCFEADTR